MEFSEVVREGEGIRTTSGGIFKLDPRNEVQNVLNERIGLNATADIFICRAAH
jgi:hypothetical protein